MKQFILALGVALSFQVFSQTKCDIQNHYGDFIKIMKKNSDDGKEYLTPYFIKVDSQYCFAELVNNNAEFIYFLWVGFRQNYRPNDLIKIEDDIALQSAYIIQLQEDSVFNILMSELTAKVVDKTVPKDTITMNALLNIAVKYFYVKKISEDGYYMGKVCGGINGIKATELESKPFIEIFASSYIMKHYYGEKYNMQNELVNAIQELYNINLGIDKEERLLRAQGAVYFLMFNNQNLREMLLYEYENKKEYLPFVLKDM
jgi:hypothetical protein